MAPSDRWPRSSPRRKCSTTHNRLNRYCQHLSHHQHHPRRSCQLQRMPSSSTNCSRAICTPGPLTASQKVAAIMPPSHLPPQLWPSPTLQQPPACASTAHPNSSPWLSPHAAHHRCQSVRHLPACAPQHLNHVRRIPAGPNASAITSTAGPGRHPRRCLHPHGRPQQSRPARSLPSPLTPRIPTTCPKCSGWSLTPSLLTGSAMTRSSTPGVAPTTRPSKTRHSLH